MIGMASSLARRLDAGGNFGDFELAIVLGAARGGAQELEVIDDDQLDVVLGLEPAGFGAQLEDAEAGGVVDVDFALGQLRGGGGEVREIALGEKAVADPLRD